MILGWMVKAVAFLLIPEVSSEHRYGHQRYNSWFVDNREPFMDKTDWMIHICIPKEDEHFHKFMPFDTNVIQKDERHAALANSFRMLSAELCGVSSLCALLASTFRFSGNSVILLFSFERILVYSWNIHILFRFNIFWTMEFHGVSMERFIPVFKHFAFNAKFPFLFEFILNLLNSLNSFGEFFALHNSHRFSFWHIVIDWFDYYHSFTLDLDPHPIFGFKWFFREK